MKILVVDDGQLAINSLVRILCRVAPDCDYISAMTTEDALTWMRQGPMDAAFLNLEMPGMNGLGLARMIQKLQPRCNIIVVTEHPEYALEALQIFVSGFLLKPANEDDVKNVLKHLRYPPEDGPAGVKIQCFGNFEIFVNGRTLAIDTGKVDCDYYNFLKGDRSAINSYRGEYMTQYSWAEVTRSALRQQASAQKTASIPSYYAPTEF